MAKRTPKLVNAVTQDVSLNHGGDAHNHAHAKRKRARVKVGGVYVAGEKASAAQLKQAVAKSADMLERLGHKIARPGIQLRVARNIPLFFADPKRPGRFLRKLNGKIESGVLEDGAFKVID